MVLNIMNPPNSGDIRVGLRHGLKKQTELVFTAVHVKEQISRVWLTEKSIYPDRANLHDKKFWLCRKCDNYVNCGKGTRPLRCIGTPEIRDRRKLTHHKTNPIWKNGKMDQKKLSELIGSKLGYGWEYHAGHIRSLCVADEVIEIVSSIESDLGIN